MTQYRRKDEVILPNFFEKTSNSENRFFEEVKAYNEKLVAWSKDSREAVEDLVVKLKEEVELAKLR
jgi:hypothetical protein